MMTTKHTTTGIDAERAVDAFVAGRNFTAGAFAVWAIADERMVSYRGALIIRASRQGANDLQWVLHLPDVTNLDCMAIDPSREFCRRLEPQLCPDMRLESAP